MGCAFVAFFVFETQVIRGIGPVELDAKRLRVEDSGGRHLPAKVFRRPPGEVLAKSSGFSRKIMTAAPSRQHMKH